jgi:transposase
MRYELSNEKWSAIKPMLPDKPRGIPRVNGSTDEISQLRCPTLLFRCWEYRF